MRCTGVVRKSLGLQSLITSNVASLLQVGMKRLEMTKRFWPRVGRVWQRQRSYLVKRDARSLSTSTQNVLDLEACVQPSPSSQPPSLASRGTTASTCETVSDRD
jgi:hypothetical protein